MRKPHRSEAREDEHKLERSDCYLLLVAMPGAPSSVLATTSKALVTSSDALVTVSRVFSKDTLSILLSGQNRRYMYMHDDECSTCLESAGCSYIFYPFCI